MEKDQLTSPANTIQHKGNKNGRLVPALKGHDFEGSSWKDYLITEKPPEVIELLKIGNAPIWTPENHSLIIGKKKSRKTLFIVLLVSMYLQQGGNIEDILICDTEQGKKHVWKIRDKIFRLTGRYASVLSLRGKSTAERKEIIKEAIEDSSFKVVVIDGVRDLLGNINDPDQCTELITYIENLTVTFNLHIVNILHQNKNDNNARGHLGTELLNKAEITIELELDESAGCTTVKCESSRDIPFEPFAFTHNSEELPELVSMPIKGAVISDTEQKQRLKYVFDQEQLKYADLIKGIMEHFDVRENKAGALKATFERKGWLIKNGKDRAPGTVYKLIIS